MNHIKYRICLFVLVLMATVFGVLYYVHGQENQGPYPGGTLVEWKLETEAVS